MSTERACNATSPTRTKLLAYKLSLLLAVILWFAGLVAEERKCERLVVDYLYFAALASLPLMVVALVYGRWGFGCGTQDGPVEDRKDG